MCGICGKFVFNQNERVSPGLIRRMLRTIDHRGPDDSGEFATAQIGLGHARLSIIDVSTGHQPLCNEDGTVWITFNGEIYNYRELRAELLARGHIFNTKTDTEVIVHLYEDLGAACVEKLRGMFAFAIWDKKSKELLLARDRVGIKPLYYYLDDRALVFGSEIKAVLADTNVDKQLSEEAIDRFLTFGYVPGNITPFRNISKLLPGHYLVANSHSCSIRQYWDLRFSPPVQQLSVKEAEEHLMQTLQGAVGQHMISDVPIGFLLSGGVDSTAMLSMAVEHTDQPLSSFTVGFSAPGIPDERPYASLAARAFGTNHYETTISAAEFSEFLPKYIWHMEEPICEPPAVALYYVSKLAREHVKVLISGEGGDEAFAGYTRYRNLVWFERIKSGLGPLRNILNPLFDLAKTARFAKLLKYQPILNTPISHYYYSGASTPYTYFNRTHEQLYLESFSGAVDKPASAALVRDWFENAREQCHLNQMLYVDTKSWLPDDLLVKADKMTMANSVELRVPFLDHRVLEFAASLPPNYKLHGFATKYLLKRALRQRIPSGILRRKKAGFPVPYEHWLRNELREWVYGVLLDSNAAILTYFKRSAVADLLAQHDAGKELSKEVFCLLVLELWHSAFCGALVEPLAAQA